MEYLVAMFGLGVLCGCALVAYAELDALDREDEGRIRRADRARAREPRPPFVSGTVLKPWPAAQPVVRHEPLRHEGSVVAYAEWLDGRVQDLETQLDRIESRHLRLVGGRGSMSTPAAGT